MAIIKNGALSGIYNGMVYCSCRARANYVRSLPKNTSEPTVRQLANRARLTFTNNVLLPFRDFISLAWERTCFTNVTAYGSAVSNMMKNGFDHSSDDLAVLWENILFCSGHLRNPAEVNLQREGDALVVSWENAAGRNTRFCRDEDVPVLIAYSPDDCTGMLFWDVHIIRLVKTLTAPLPEAFSKSRLHVYLQFITSDFTRCSKSCYLGYV